MSNKYSGVVAVFILGAISMQFAGCDNGPPKTPPVSPLSLDSIQPLRGDAKREMINNIEDRYSQALIDRLLHLSLEPTIPVIHIVHVRENESSLIPQIQSDVVEPVFAFLEKYTGLMFIPANATLQTPPFDRWTLVIRYHTESVEYVGAGVNGTTVRLDLSLYESGKSQGLDLSISMQPPSNVRVFEHDYADARKHLERSVLRGLKNQLGGDLLIDRMSGRQYPFDPEEEARHRWIEANRRNHPQEKTPTMPLPVDSTNETQVDPDLGK